MTKFATYKAPYDYPQSVILMDKIIEIIGMVRKLKSEKQLSLKTEFSHLTLGCQDDELRKKLESNRALIKGITRANSLAFISETLENRIVQENEIFTATLNI
jgi:valyl-tRNA synthetase